VLTLKSHESVCCLMSQFFDMKARRTFDPSPQHFHDREWRNGLKDLESGHTNITL
jgi:hypothetical protein